ncbi:glycosyltransferase [Paenibacillus sp. GCM10027627]|uniref:glycosyltransferase n=1 Tax=unclassified Paenibacillus TaxID=185978 RepID=UPI003644438F
MKRHLITLFVIGMTLAVGMSSVQASAAGRAEFREEKISHGKKQQQCLTESAVQLKWNLRRLWIDHVVYTRDYIVSAVEGLADKDKILARLLKNQQDIGDAVKPFYGEAAGNKLAELLREHILIADKIVEAAKSGQQAEVEKLDKDWHRNADDIAKFLSDANPNWTDKELKDLLYTHLQMVTDAVVARIKKDWDADIAAFDKGINHIIVLSDALADGIIKQFPKEFK